MSEYTFMEALAILGQAGLKMTIEIVIPVAIGMVVIYGGAGALRGLLNPKPVPVPVRNRKNKQHRD